MEMRVCIALTFNLLFDSVQTAIDLYSNITYTVPTYEGNMIYVDCHIRDSNLYITKIAFSLDNPDDRTGYEWGCTWTDHYRFFFDDYPIYRDRDRFNVAYAITDCSRMGDPSGEKRMTFQMPASPHLNDYTLSCIYTVNLTREFRRFPDDTVVYIEKIYGELKLTAADNHICLVLTMK